MMDQDRKLIVLVGPTAVGKTAMAVEMAQHFQTSILSADSRQCFRELNIGVAKPSPEQLQLIPHYFINSHSIHEDVNASLYEQWALKWVDEIFAQSDTAIAVGGTGLYIRALCEGLDEIPDVDPSVRQQIIHSYEELGMEWLSSQVKALDPSFYAAGEIQNPQRLMRALEVRLSTGKSILSFRKGNLRKRPFAIRKIGLALPKETLHRNIHSRVDQMMDLGLLDEVKDLYPYRARNALQTVGYTELFSYLDGDISLDQAIGQIKTNTRHYAKRQMTWFRKDPSIEWMQAGELKKLIHS